ncbi:MAG: signal peptidase [Actinomycetota bacterium]|jgi:signal peptidase I
MTPPDTPEEAPSALSRLERALAGFGEPKPPADPEPDAPSAYDEPDEIDDDELEPDEDDEPTQVASSPVLDIAAAVAAVDHLSSVPPPPAPSEPEPQPEPEPEPEPEPDPEELLARPPSGADARVLRATAAGTTHDDDDDDDDDDDELTPFEPVDLRLRYHDVDDDDDESDDEPEPEPVDEEPVVADTALPYFLVEDNLPVAADPVSTVQDLREQLVRPQERVVVVKQPAQPKPPASIARTLAEIPILLIVAALIAFLVKTFLAQAYYIPSGSMLPQLQIDDRVVVSKLAYKVHDPRRGDIIVFDDPRTGASTTKADEGLLRKVGEGIGIVQPSTDEFIKRVIGLPGETVQGRNGHVYVNGHQLIEPYLKDTVITSDFPKTTVRSGRLWVMGDNRTGSADSRVFGQIKIDTIVGRALVKVWPFDHISFL